ncbi:MAG: carboxylesterase/lipase family protein [Acidobacteria bacterium]|nr:carboxylesterase/lipase family protein [Acidobacteriota bacterium]
MRLTRRETLTSTFFVSAALSAKTEFVEVKTAYGRIRGAMGDGVATFKGVPYAGSVSGANRFKPAPPLQPWTGVRDALQFGAPSCQPGQRRNEPPQSEDCLFLNIWTPAPDKRKRPVMFYSHGGGFTTGSAASAYQDASGLARTFDVVVVSTNHRLGLMGYLYMGDLGGEEFASSGNQGLLDICDGLKWVHQNIEAFGGDPDNVMIFGESGGGAKTSCLYAMPSAAPFFNKASIESGPGIRMFPREAAAETTSMALKQLGLERREWRKLLDVPADKLIEVQAALAKAPSSGPLTMTGGRSGIGGNRRPGGFGPVVDGNVLPHHPFDPQAPAISKNKPLIVGYNRDETVFFFQQRRDTSVFHLSEAALKERLAQELGANAGVVFEAYRKSRPEAAPTDLYIAITTARMIGTGAITIAERKYAQHGAPVYMYIFTHESDAIVPGTQHKVGAAHAFEIRYKFYNLSPPSDRESEKTAHNMSEMWSTFARTGRPAAKGQPAWPAYTTGRRATMEIAAQCRVVHDPYRSERSMWERLEL